MGRKKKSSKEWPRTGALFCSFPSNDVFTDFWILWQFGESSDLMKQKEESDDDDILNMRGDFLHN